MTKFSVQISLYHFQAAENGLALGELDLTSQDFMLDEVDGNLRCFAVYFINIWRYISIYLNRNTDEMLRLCLTVYIQANLEDDIVKEALKTVKLSVGLYFPLKKGDLN